MISPHKLKRSNIIPICEGGKTIEPNNYRSIALLSIISKIFVMLIASNLMKYLKKVFLRKKRTELRSQPLASLNFTTAVLIQWLRGSDR